MNRPDPYPSRRYRRGSPSLLCRRIAGPMTIPLELRRFLPRGAHLPPSARAVYGQHRGPSFRRLDSCLLPGRVSGPLISERRARDPRLIPDPALPGNSKRYLLTPIVSGVMLPLLSNAGKVDRPLK